MRKLRAAMWPARGHGVRSLAAWVVGVGTVLGLACTGGNGGGSSSCTPGQSAACACTDGASGSQVCQSSGTYEACKCTGSGSSGGSGSGGDDGGGSGGSSSGSFSDGPACGVVCDIENGATEAVSTTYWSEQGLGGGYSDMFGIYRDGTIASLRSTPTLGASSGCYYGVWTAGSDGFATTGWPASLTSINVQGGSVASGAVSFTATDNEGNVHAPLTFHLENTTGKSPFAGCVPSGDAGVDGAVDAGGGG